MIILGIDPGFSVTGFSVIKKERQSIQLLDFGVLKLSPKESLSKRIGQFHSECAKKIIQHGITVVALETPFLGKNAQNFLKLGYLRGVLYLLADQHNLQIFEFAPSQVKMTLTGYGLSPKLQMARVLVRLFPGLTIPDKLDASDAIAVSLCAAWAHRPILAKR
jgi:crossover junction endodeoxyribonuclease RuvC